MSYLDQLEHETVFILREAFARVKPTAMLWSIGKDLDRPFVGYPEGLFRSRSISHDPTRYRDGVTGSL